MRATSCAARPRFGPPSLLLRNLYAPDAFIAAEEARELLRSYRRRFRSRPAFTLITGVSRRAEHVRPVLDHASCDLP